jgi:hypothetical protein
MSERLAPSHQTVRLARGKHDTPADGACVLELASMLAGEPFGDQPRSVSPVIAAYLRTYNDGADDVSRRCSTARRRAWRVPAPAWRSSGPARGVAPS